MHLQLNFHDKAWTGFGTRVSHLTAYWVEWGTCDPGNEVDPDLELRGIGVGAVLFCSPCRLSSQKGSGGGGWPMGTGAHFSKDPETPETSCMKRTSFHIKNL